MKVSFDQIQGDDDGARLRKKSEALTGGDGFGIVDDLGSSSEVSSAGDVNGDGFADVIIGGSSGAYVVFGKATPFTATLNRSALDGSNGFELTNSGQVSAVSAAGDINGDGFSDLIIGAVATSVVFGHAGSFASGIDVTTLDGTNGFTLTGEASGDGFGAAVSGAGDLNGDNFGDVIIGAPSRSAWGRFRRSLRRLWQNQPVLRHHVRLSARRHQWLSRERGRGGGPRGELREPGGRHERRWPCRPHRRRS